MRILVFLYRIYSRRDRVHKIEFAEIDMYLCNWRVHRATVSAPKHCGVFTQIAWNSNRSFAKISKRFLFVGLLRSQPAERKSSRLSRLNNVSPRTIRIIITDFSRIVAIFSLPFFRYTISAVTLFKKYKFHTRYSFSFSISSVISVCAVFRDLLHAFRDSRVSSKYRKKRFLDAINFVIFTRNSRIE